MRIETIVAPNPGPYTLDGTRSYVLERRAIVDPGPADPRHLDALASAAPALETIFITHRHDDHAPGAAALRARTGARIAGPPGIEPRADVPLEDGLRFEVGTGSLEAIATPGHTGEHFCFLTADGELFTGDTILGEGTTAIFPPDGDMADYLESLRKLRARKPRAIYPGHGPVRHDADAWIDYYIGHRIERETQVIDAIRAGAANVSELRERIYPDLDSRLRQAAELQLQAHLAKLAREGRAARAGDRWTAVGPP